MKNPLQWIVTIIGCLFIYWLLSNHLSYNNQTFDPALVTAKQKCQTDLEKWSNENTSSNALGFDRAIRAHFNPKLNTCLIDYIYNRVDGSQQSEIIDIYDSNRKLLELDIDSQSSMVPGEFLYENNKKVDTNSPYSEYEKRAAALFEEPVPTY